MLISSESSMSSNPPKAGIALLESLTAISLFIIDSIKSPIMPDAPTSRPKGTI